MKVGIISQTSRFLKGLFLRDGTETLLHALSWTLILRVIGAFLSFVYTAVIARLLGAESAGQYFFAFSIAMFLSTLGRAGLDNAVPRFVSVAYDRENWIGLKILFWRIISAVTLISLAIAGSLYFSARFISNAVSESHDITVILQIIAFSIVTFGLMTILSEFLRAVGDLKASVLVSAIAHVAIGLLLLWPLVAHFGVEGAAFTFVIATTMSGCLAAARWFWHLGRLPESGSGIALKPVVESAKHFFVISIAGQAIMPYAPSILIGVWSSDEEVAIFSVAARICMIVGLLQVAANIVVGPRFANLFDRKDFKGLESVAKSASMLVTVTAAPLILCGIVFSRFVMGFFGNEYQMGGAVLSILLLGQFLNVMIGSVGTLLMMTGYELQLGRLTLVSAAALIVVCTLLIPAYGGLGAAVGATAATAVLNFSALFTAQRKLGIQASLIPNFSRHED